jgi:hypothetical protein
MPRFDPAPGEEIELDVDGVRRCFHAMRHPAGPSFVHAMEGAKAHVYHVREVPNGAEYALKVMKSRFREASLVERCAALDALKTLPGMAVCERRCLTLQSSPGTLARFCDLEYSILMPWMVGHTWYDVVQAGAMGRDLARAAEALSTAEHLVEVLAALEERGVAHCDLSAGNVVVDPAVGSVALVDVEDVFTPLVSAPSAIPGGTPGYQHRTSHAGMWRLDGDRFAGAVLLAEMLGWYDPAVRAAAAGESYFDADELQDPGSARLTLLLAALRRHRNGEGLVVLLKRAWASVSLGECPMLAEWQLAIGLACKGVAFSRRKIEAMPPRPLTVFWTPIPRLAAPPARVKWSQPTRPALVPPDEIEDEHDH